MVLPIADSIWKGTVESVSQEGLGIGTVKSTEDGKLLRRPIFIPFTAPGDEVEAEIIEQKRKYLFGQVISVLTPSENRVIPLCPHYTICGGCNLQHIAYDEQLRQKASQIAFLLERKGISLPRKVTVLPAKQRHNYRWRAKIAVHFTGARPVVGFRRHRSNEIIPISTCFIVAKEIVELIQVIGKASLPLGGISLDVIAVVGQDKKVGLLIALDEIPQHLRKHVKEFFDEIYSRNRKLIANLFFEENRTTRTSGQVQEHITYPVAGMKLSFLPETFIQSNVPTNELLVSTVVDMAFRSSEKVVVDLYAGLGNITLPVAKKAGSVVAVEGHEASVLLGRINCYQNGLENVLFLHRSTERYVYEYVKHAREQDHNEEYPKADAIILDPPRTGCTPQILKGLLNTAIPTIVYVSCNPATLANDLTVLSAKYKVADIVAIDMFPDISHVETVVLLQGK
jgi:23S rRNA (uracil1939-C5)-methyltransferase